MESEGHGEVEAGSPSPEAAVGVGVAGSGGGGEELPSLENVEETCEDEEGSESSSSASEAELEEGIAAEVSGGHESDEDSVDESELASSAVVSNSGIDADALMDSELRKRKKKKKKKKKKKSTKDAELDRFAALEAQMLPPEIADKRYSSSLESMRNDDSLLWMQLNRCRITDKKARKLFAALKDNTTLTSLDLSENLLTDESLQSLEVVLSAGSAPNLIYVDVRANPISTRSQDVLGRLQNLRKHLKVDYYLEASDQGVGEGGRADDDGWLEGFPRNKWTANSEENGDSHSWDENPMTNIHIRFPTPEALQEKVESALLSIKKSSTSLHVSGLAGSLREIIINFSQQLSLFRGTSTDWKTVEALPKGLPLLLEKIGVFLSVLDMNPPPILCQRKLEEQVAGLHRVALVELLNLLIMPSSPYIEEKLLAESTPARLVRLFFQFPWNSILQGAIFRFLQTVLSRPSLRFSVLEGSAGLPSLLPKAGEECAALSIGRRPGYGGYIVKLSRELEVLAAKDVEVQKILGENEQWATYVRPGGALKKMVAEQTGHLGGPKPFSRSVPHYFQDDSMRADSALEQFRGLFLP
ncbi:unnamed protein product [Calypogeia fissa]